MENEQMENEQSYCYRCGAPLEKNVAYDGEYVFAQVKQIGPTICRIDVKGLCEQCQSELDNWLNEKWEEQDGSGHNN